MHAVQRLRDLQGRDGTMKEETDGEIRVENPDSFSNPILDDTHILLDLWKSA
ncbi:MAG: hypothetical protein M1830_007432, partial [Pleopsidium flavum]